MDINNPVIVMALYDIGRENWNNFRMSYHTYGWWMRNTLSLDSNIVVYTDSKFMSELVNYRKEFFKVTLDEIEQKTKEIGLGTEFLRLPEANEYKETLAMLEKLNSKLEYITLDQIIAAEFPSSLTG